MNADGLRRAYEKSFTDYRNIVYVEDAFANVSERSIERMGLLAVATRVRW
jgi:hypothetical protein